jgi:hypothetical protein
MPLYTIIHIDHEGIHPHSCTLIVASSVITIAEDILENPDRWRAALLCAHADDGDSRSLWQRLQSDSLTPQELLTLIDRTTLDAGFGEMLRIYPIEIKSLDDFQAGTRWSNSETNKSSQLPTISERLETLLSSDQDQQGKLLIKNQGNLDKLRERLSADARSLLSTPEFREYVRDLLNQNIWKYSELGSFQLSISDLSTWHLSSLGVPLRIRDIEKTLRDRTNEAQPNPLPQHLHLDVCFGLWHQNLKIPVDEENADFSEFDSDDLEQRWLMVGRSLKNTIERTGFLISPEVTPQQQQKLVLELACVVAYIVELVFRGTSNKTFQI